MITHDRVIQRMQELLEEYKKQSIEPDWQAFLVIKLVEKEDWEKNVRKVMSSMPFSLSELLGESYEDEEDDE